jgi:hypothetical protein
MLRTILWIIVVIILINWLLGITLWAAGGMIHLLLVLAVIIIILNLLAGPRNWW